MAITVERAGHALVLREPGADEQAAAIAAALPEERHRTSVVVGASAWPALARLDPWLVADLDDQVDTGVRLLAAHSSTMAAGEVSLARRLADRLGVEVIAPDGDLYTLTGGHTFATGLGWVAHGAGSDRRPMGHRFPEPWWQGYLPSGHEEIPLGLWVRAGGGPSREDDPLRWIQPDPERPTVVVGAPGEPAPSAADVVEVLDAFPVDVRGRVVLACYGTDIAQAVARERGAAVRALHGLPSEHGLVHLDPDGHFAWYPFAIESVYRPGCAPVLDRWTAPLPSLAMFAPARYRLTPGWSLDVLARGLLARPDTLPVDPAIHTPTAPTPDLLLACGPDIPPDVIAALTEVLDNLPATTKSTLRILPATPGATLAARSLASHLVGTPPPPPTPWPEDHTQRLTLDNWSIPLPRVTAGTSLLTPESLNLPEDHPATATATAAPTPLPAAPTSPRATAATPGPGAPTPTAAPPSPAADASLPPLAAAPRAMAATPESGAPTPTSAPPTTPPAADAPPRPAATPPSPPAGSSITPPQAAISPAVGLSPGAVSAGTAVGPHAGGPSLSSVTPPQADTPAAVDLSPGAVSAGTVVGSPAGGLSLPSITPPQADTPAALDLSPRAVSAATVVGLPAGGPSLPSVTPPEVDTPAVSAVPAGSPAGGLPPVAASPTADTPPRAVATAEPVSPVTVVASSDSLAGPLLPLATSSRQTDEAPIPAHASTPAPSLPAAGPLPATPRPAALPTNLAPSAATAAPRPAAALPLIAASTTAAAPPKATTSDIPTPTSAAEPLPPTANTTSPTASPPPLPTSAPSAAAVPPTASPAPLPTSASSAAAVPPTASPAPLPTSAPLAAAVPPTAPPLGAMAPSMAADLTNPAATAAPAIPTAAPAIPAAAQAMPSAAAPQANQVLPSVEASPQRATIAQPAGQALPPLPAPANEAAPLPTAPGAIASLTAQASAPRLPSVAPTSSALPLPAAITAPPAANALPALVSKAHTDPAVPADARSDEAQRRAVRASLGTLYDSATRAVVQLLAERPGLRASGDQATLLTELAVVRVFAEAPGAYDTAFHTCLTAGLRRLPTMRGVVVTGAHQANHAEGALLRLEGPMLAVSSVGASVPGDTELLIWTTTARRLEGLLDADRRNDVVIPTHTALRVLGVEGNRLLLAEEGASTERALSNLRAAAAARAAVDVPHHPHTARWFGALPAA
ncbi:hypothetical protein [Actinokineospora cianjurensis]|uniref:Uncharacterized protein n=1 Tax=Actinokineospora cianjurensis TaxID=585224 RepID=A0A421AWZ4_9PSEU|nr:hypothetical protein [Actinokineospora cianjurensis]RLK54352.1 hypothetical protein CLV68_5902 [Actinokineospora cianjurensis]